MGSSFPLIQLIAAEPSPPDLAGIENALHKALQASRFRSSLHYTAELNTLALSPDNTLLAAGSEDGVTLVWPLDSADPTPSYLSSGDDPVSIVVFHPTAPILATAQKNDSVSLWRTDTLQLAYRFPQQPDVIHDMTYGDMAYSPDGRYLATACSDGQVAIWDISLSDPQPIHEFPHKEAVYEVIFNQDGSRLVTAGENKKAQVWDVTTQQVIFETPLKKLAFWGQG